MTSTIKLVFVGNSQTGKTRLVEHFHGNHTHTYIPTLGVEVCPFRFNENIYNIWDTAGNPNYEGLGDGYYIDGQMFFIFKGGVGKSVEQYAHEIRRVRPDAKIFTGTYEQFVKGVATLLK